MIPTSLPPSPALVTREAAQRLPRWPLALLCLAYLVPGLIGRDPWKNADITAFGYMASIARGDSFWLSPTIGGLLGPSNLLPYSIGAASIKLFGPWLGAPIAARLPFAVMLGLILWMTWGASYFLARTEAAQPATFAFGGEANSNDYAHAIGDGALLALIASLGLLQLGHETTPELGQLLGCGMLLLGLAAAPYRIWMARMATLLSLPIMAASGAPTLAIVLGLTGWVISQQSSFDAARQLRRWLLIALALAIAYAQFMSLWQWRWGQEYSIAQILRLLVWFTWPTWPLALWTLWRWRYHWNRRHIAAPAAIALATTGACVFMGGNDRALMLGLPALATLAAFSLPTLRRDVSAAIDWFSLLFFSFWAIIVWTVYLSLVTGWPSKPAMNVTRLLPGLPALQPSAVITSIAILGTIAWIILVIWRGGRHKHPLWTSLVLPASGVALIWLLVMSLMLPVVNYARSYRPYVDLVLVHIAGQPSCLRIDGQTALIAAFENDRRVRVYAEDAPAAHQCDWRLKSIPIQRESRQPSTPQWRVIARVRRPGDKDESAVLYRRTSDTHSTTPTRASPSQ